MLARYILHTHEVSAIITFVIRRLMGRIVSELYRKSSGHSPTARRRANVERHNDSRPRMSCLAIGIDSY